MSLVFVAPTELPVGTGISNFFTAAPVPDSVAGARLKEPGVEVVWIFVYDPQNGSFECYKATLNNGEVESTASEEHEWPAWAQEFVEKSEDGSNTVWCQSCKDWVAPQVVGGKSNPSIMCPSHHLLWS